MKKLLVIGASNSSESVNKAFATHAASLVEGAESRVLDLNDFETPLYSMDREKADGVPEKARDFLAAIGEADGVVISLAEHNGSYSAAFKNLLDWASRAREKMDVWQDKTMLLLATSPGGRGGATVHGLASTYFPYMSARVNGAFTLPKFYDHFSAEDGVTDPELKAVLDAAVAEFHASL